MTVRPSPPPRLILQYVSLLYSGSFFVQPYLRQSVAGWLWFAAFYLAFLALYFAIPAANGRRRTELLAALFALGFAYYPFNTGAAGVFVYAMVMVALALRRIGLFLAVLAVVTAAVALERWSFRLPANDAVSAFFFSVVLGLSYLAFFQEQRANAELETANERIAALTQAAERERIARDMHDLLGHTLTLITLKLDLARRLLPDQPDRARIEVVDAEQTARTALADVRQAVTGLRSSGLAAEIERVRHVLRSAGVSLSTAIAPVAASPAQVDALCLVLREAVTNIVRHASARRCRIDLSVVGAGPCLSVTDDGIGGPLREGNGLRGMRERVGALGGSLRIGAAEGGGTALLASLPPAVGG